MALKQEVSGVIATFSDEQHAQHYLDELKRAGFADDEVGILRGHSKATDLEDDALAGAISGGMVGAVAGAAAVSLVPGIGPGLAAGLLAGLVGGSATGGVLGFLVGLGIPETKARRHEQAVMQGHSLVVVQARGRGMEALAILRQCEKDLGPQSPPTVTSRKSRSLLRRLWHGRTAEVYRADGEEHLEHGHPEQAVREFTEAIHLDPHNVTNYLDRGLAYEAEGKYQEAISDYDLAVRLDPHNVDAYVHRGDAWFALDDFHQAVHNYTEALRLDPTHALARYYRALAHQERGEVAEAKADREEALRLNPGLAHLKDSLKAKAT